MTRLTLIQAQERYIKKVIRCHPGHTRRVRRGAWKELFKWAESRGFDVESAKIICRDADDMLKLENISVN